MSNFYLTCGTVSGGNPTDTGDLAMRDALVTAGHTVTSVQWVAGSAPPDLSAYDAAIITESTGTSIGAGWASVTKPVLCLAWYWWDELGMSNTGSPTSGTLGQLYPLDNAITTAAGLTAGTAVTIWTAPQTGRWARATNLGAGVTVYAKDTSDASLNLYSWGYESGAAMAVGTAPARRHGLSMPNEGTLNTSGMAYFVATAEAVAGSSTPPPTGGAVWYSAVTGLPLSLVSAV